MSNDQHISASFRDPNGFLFHRDENLYRQVNQRYKKNYDHLFLSGLYEKLVVDKLLIPHNEVNIPGSIPSIGYKVIQPERVPFISYPYEWSFSQLKDAALLTLKIQQIAIQYGMSLKDASAYNIQFHKGKPILIDTLSFEIYEEGKPWIAYKQFCQHFLAPLALMAKKDVRLSQLSRVHIDGVPLDLTSRLLPQSSKFNFGLMAHIHLHGQALLRYADSPLKISQQGRKIRKQSFVGLIDNIENTVRKLEWKTGGTEWANYYSFTNYSDASFVHKKEVLSKWIGSVRPCSLWDLGANNGLFTRLCSERGISSVAFDADPVAVEQNYQQVKSANEHNILPLLLDLTNPSPAMGWHGQERDSLAARAPADMVFALALIHHLVISNNIPLEKLSNYFSDIGKWLIIEFVPKSDSKVQRLLRNRVDIFDQYTLEIFENVFSSAFIIQEKVRLEESERVLYLMKKR